MTMLIFKDGDYTVATTAWSAVAKNIDYVDIAYLWGVDTISFFSGATSVSRIEFKMSMNQFLSHKKGDVIDLRQA